MGSMKIGALAKAAQVKVSTVRFYEAEGLLPKPETRESGYREYGPADLERLRLIIAAKEQRFPLKLIRDCLKSLDDGDTPCEQVAKIVEERLAAIDQEIGQLQQLKKQFTAQLSAYQEGRLPQRDCLCAILQSEPKGDKE